MINKIQYESQEENDSYKKKYHDSYNFRQDDIVTVSIAIKKLW